MSGVWRLDGILGTARHVQTDLERGFGHAGVGKLGHTGICGPQCRVLPPHPIGPAATGAVCVLGVSWCAGSCQSVSHHLPGVAPRSGGFELCVHTGICLDDVPSSSVD